MVAKSYQHNKILCEPYSVNGRLYVKIECGKSEKQVRWYSEREYSRLYPDATVEILTPRKTQKEILGFDKGYITIFKGNTYEDRDYFKLNSARYCKLWGWYFISTIELPEDLPEDVEPIQLNWELVGGENGELFDDEKVQAVIESLIYDAGTSEFVGNIGERLELILTVDRAVALDGYYGASTLHQMSDEKGNVFIWTTATKSWGVGSIHHIKGTVKDHKVYHNEKQTYLTRCSEIK